MSSEAHTFTATYERLHLLSFDSDPFNRWDAGQRLALKLLLEAIADCQAGRPVSFPNSLAVAFSHVLADASQDPAFATEVLVLPPEVYIGEQMAVIDPAVIHQVRQALRRYLAEHLHDALHNAYDTFIVTGDHRPDAELAGRRALRNLCLAYLMELDDPTVRTRCVAQLQDAGNMTDALAALTALANCDCPERQPALNQFYAKWQAEPLVVDKWLGVQAMSRLPGTLAAVKMLTAHPAFTLKNPNKVYALLGGFGGNQVHFHAADGSGYAFIVEQISTLDPINPQVVAACMARYFERWRRFDAQRQALMQAALTQLAAAPGLSKETTEVVTKALA